MESDEPGGKTPEPQSELGRAARELDRPITDPRELSFDQYARYRLAAEVLRRSFDEQPFRVLDVGGRTGILRDFLPGVPVAVVDVETSELEGLVLGDGSRLPFADGSVDAVTACDTLEHVPVERREAFVRECCRVARDVVVLAGPYRAPRVDAAEEALAELVAAKTGERHRYLDEHRALGLPELAAVEGWLGAAGLEVHAVGHGNLERWLALLSVSLYMDSDPHLRGVARRYYRFFNEALFDLDHEAPHYRHAVVACRPGRLAPGALELFEPRALPPEARGAFAQVVDELVAFDRERDVYEAERDRLTEVNEGLLADLEAHRETVLELRRLNDERVLHVAELQAEIEREQAESRALEQGLRTEIAGHRAAVEELVAAQGELEQRLDAANRTAVELDGRLVAADAELARLRGELRSRKRNLRRALSWKKPAF